MITKYELRERLNRLDDDALARHIIDALDDRDREIAEDDEVLRVWRRRAETAAADAEALAKAADRVWLIILNKAHGNCPICGARFDCDCEDGCPGDALVTALAAYYDRGKG